MRRLSHHTQRLIARVHLFILGFSLLGYLALVFTLGPGFLSFDVSQKIRALADEIIVVTATVLGPPATPVVTATPSCVGSSSPRITLDWADDAATSSWDIERDSAPLVTGLTNSQYIDTAVSGTNTYSYVVTAYGPMAPGIATSTPVSATAIDCSTLLPDPTVTITTIKDTNVTPPRPETIGINGSRPRITGNTNIQNAIIDISIDRPTILARITANENGYFSWIPPRALLSGSHSLTVTATDPNDNSRTITDSLNFFRKDNASGDDGRAGRSTPLPLVPQSVPTNIAPPDTISQPAFDFGLNIGNADFSVRQGKRLEFSLKPTKGLFPVDTIFEIMFLDRFGKVVFTAPSYTITPEDRPGLNWSIDVPAYLPEGEYSLQIVGTFGETVISRSLPFTITSLPVFSVGDQQVITYSEIAGFTGWIFFGSLTLFSLFFLALLHEYWMYLHGLRAVTGRGLQHFGFIPWRKGVRK